MDIDLADKQQLIDYLKSHDLWAKKDLGQNFLVCRDTLDSIILASDLSDDDIILEVGPGLGVLTQELCKNSGKVIAVEKDAKLVGLLKQNTKDFNNIEIVTSDVFKLQPTSYNLQPYKVVANIPYYLTSHLIQYFLEHENPPSMMVLMVQKEVAQRIVAHPPKMELLSVLVQYWADAEIIKEVPRTCFFPEPNVDSAIIKLKAKTYKLKAGETKKLFRIVKAGFSNKRKTLENSLSGSLQLSKEKTRELLLSVGIEPNRRAETLSLEEWNKLSEGFWSK